MKHIKWIAPVPAYLAVWAGLFLFHSAWFALFGFHIAILAALLFLRPHFPIRSLLKSSSPKRIFTSLLFCGGSGLALSLLWKVFGVAKDLPSQLHSIGLSASAWPMFIAYFSLANPVIEEYFWRGALGEPSRKPVIGDLIYAGYHALILWDRVHPVSILFAVIILTCAGWFWRQITREDGGLLAAVLGHMAADFSILLTIYLMTS